MSKIILIKHLSPVSPKLVPKLKVFKFIQIWHIQYFKYANLDFHVKAQNLLRFGQIDISNMPTSILMSK